MRNDVFKALADQTRREILNRLKEKDLTTGEIADYFSISKPSISHHLTILKTAGLITQEKKGQFIYYSLNTTVLQDIYSWILKLKQ